MKLLSLTAAALSVALVGGYAYAQTKKEVKPTGACTITVYGITPTCTGSMTQASCTSTATKVSGVSDWKEGKSCPSK